MSRSAPFTLAELAQRLDAQLLGEAQQPIEGLATLQQAQPGQLSFLANPKYRKYLAASQASAVILSAEDQPHWSGSALVVADPYLTYAKAAALFDPTPMPAPGIHPSAVVDPSAQVAASASIGPQVVIEAGATIGEQVVLGAGCYVGEGSQVGAYSRLFSHVCLYHGVSLGQSVRVQANTVIGSDGFGYAPHQGQWHKIPQIGGVVIGDHVEIGACTTIDRGALGDTVIADHVILDNNIQIAHNVQIGEGTAIAACVGIAGSAKIGRHCTIAGAVGIAGHVEIADNVHFTGMAMVTKSVSAPGVYSSGTGLLPNGAWRKSSVRFKQLDEMAKRIQKLEKQVAELNE